MCASVWEVKMYTSCVNGGLVSDPSQLLQVWTQHFQNLAKSQGETNATIKESMKQALTLLSATLKEEVFLNVPFSSEEVEYAVNKMKLKKSAVSLWNI